MPSVVKAVGSALGSFFMAHRIGDSALGGQPFTNLTLNQTVLSQEQQEITDAVQRMQATSNEGLLNLLTEKQAGASTSVDEDPGSSSLLSDQQTLEVALQIQNKIDRLKSEIAELTKQSAGDKEATSHVSELKSTLSVLESNDHALEEVELKLEVQWLLSLVAKSLSVFLALGPLLVCLQALCSSPSRQHSLEVIDKQTSWPILIVNVLNNAVWTSYSFKRQSIELATVFVINLVINILLVAVCLFVRPQQKLIV